MFIGIILECDETHSEYYYIKKYIRFYKLSPKSSLNLETSSSCQ